MMIRIESSLMDALKAYYVLFHILGVIILLPWIIRTSKWGSVVDSDGISRTWWYASIQPIPFSTAPIAMSDFTQGNLYLCDAFQ